jgi:prepilin-type N-terminal cleavage/methylation domain-containing protein
MTFRSQSPKGFTLIELLIVIGIVVILSVAVVLTLNPAQLLRQARDATRISDLNTLKSALALYLADVSTIDLGTWTNCYAHTSSTITCTNRFTGGTATMKSSTAVDGAGWLPVKFTDISSGAPLSALPLDPVNNSTYYYAYRATSTAQTYEINADMESLKYGRGGSGDVETNDGGSDANIYELGTDPGLDL